MSRLADIITGTPGAPPPAEPQPAEFPGEFIAPEILTHPPGDGRDFTQVGRLYFPKDQPDPVLVKIKEMWEQRNAERAGALVDKAKALPGQVLDTVVGAGGAVGRGLAAAGGAVQAADPNEQLQDPYAAGAPSAPPAQETAPAGPPPQTREGLEGRVLGHMEGAADQAVAADQAEAAAEAEAAVARQGRLEAHQRELETVTRERDKVVGEQVTKVRTIADQARNTQINAKQLWQDASFGEKTSTLLGVALGGLLAPYGTRNPALDIFQRRVTENIEAQKANLDNLNQSVANERSILGDLRMQFGDKLAAENAMYGLALDQVVNELDVKLAGVKDQKALARGQAMKAQIQGQALDYWNQAEARAAAKAQQDFENGLARRRVALEGARLKEEKRQFDEQLKQRQAEAGLDFLTKIAEQGAAAAKAGAQAQLDQDTIDPYVVVGAAPLDDTTGKDRVRFSDKVSDSALASTKETVANGRIAQHLAADLQTLGFDRNLTPDQRSVMAKSVMANMRLETVAGMIKGAASKEDQRIVDEGLAITDPQAFLGWLSEPERARVFQATADSAFRKTNEKLRPSGLQLAPIVRTPVTGDPTPRERSPGAKVIGIDSASESVPLVQGARVGDVESGVSPRGEEYRSAGNTAPESLKSQTELKALEGKLLFDIDAYSKRIAKEKDAGKRKELELNRNEAMKAVLKLQMERGNQSSGRSRQDAFQRLVDPIGGKLDGPRYLPEK